MARPQTVPPEAATAPATRPEAEGTPSGGAVPLHLSELKTHHVTELVEMATANGIENASRLRKQDLIFALLKNQAKKGASIYGDGTLEVLPGTLEERGRLLGVAAEQLDPLPGDVLGGHECRFARGDRIDVGFACPRKHPYAQPEDQDHGEQPEQRERAPSLRFPAR